MEQVLHINEIEVGAPRDGNLISPSGLSSAVARPAQSAGGRDGFPSVHEKAAALFEALVQNHPFLIGNKRTAVLALFAFYGFNGYVFEMPDLALFHVATATAIHEIDLAGLAREFEKHARLLPDFDPDEAP